MFVKVTTEALLCAKPGQWVIWLQASHICASLEIQNIHKHTIFCMNTLDTNTLDSVACCTGYNCLSLDELVMQLCVQHEPVIAGKSLL